MEDLGPWLLSPGEDREDLGPLLLSPGVKAEDLSPCLLAPAEDTEDLPPLEQEDRPDSLEDIFRYYLDFGICTCRLRT